MLDRAFAARARSSREEGGVRGVGSSGPLDRYEGRGELQKALGIARAIEGESERVLDLEERLADREDGDVSETRPDSIPVFALGALAGSLGVDPDTLDPPRIEVTEQGIRYHLAGGSSAGGSTVDREVDDLIHARLVALVEEWRWRRVALARAGYAERTEGVPVSLQAGIGASGVSVIPRFLPEGYVAHDRPYFE